jgi:hypothetical protein
MIDRHRVRQLAGQKAPARTERELLAVAEPLALAIERALPALRAQRWEFRPEVFAEWCRLTPSEATPDPGFIRDAYASVGPTAVDAIRAEIPRFLHMLTPRFLRLALGDLAPRCPLDRLVDVAGTFILEYPEHDQFQRQREGWKDKAGHDLARRVKRAGDTFVLLEYYTFNAVMGL